MILKLQQKSLLLRSLLIIFILIPFPSDACNSKEVQELLLKLKLDPSITNNQLLVKEVEYKYGEEITKYLTSQNNYLLNKPDNPIDEKTLMWVRDAIWNAKSPRTRYLPILISDNAQVLNEYIHFLVENLDDFSRKTSLVFSNKQSFKHFKKHFEKNGYAILKEISPDATEEQIFNTIKLFMKNYLREKAYSIKFNSIKLEKIIVVIHGHGSAGFHGISIGGHDVPVQQLVDILDEIKLPNTATIKLTTCFSGCPSSPFNLTTMKIEELLLNNNLQNLVDSDTDSLLHVFSETLMLKQPSFTGEIQGYLGPISTLAEKNVLDKKGRRLPLANAVKISGSDGILLVKKEDARVSNSKFLR